MRRWPRWRQFANVVRLGRLHFLLGGFATFALGAAAGPFGSVGRYALAQFMVSSAQMAAHFLNEYADRFVDEAITNRTAFSGGSGVLVAGHVDPIVALRAGQVASLLSVIAAALVWRFSWVAALLGLVALAVSWGYSMPPVRLLGTGWGELATSLVVVGVVPMVGAASQGTVPPPALYVALVTLIPIHFAMMLAFEVPDIGSDAAAGKKVLAVRLGRARTMVLLVASLALGAGSLLIGVVAQVLARQAVWAFGAVLPASVVVVSLRTDRFATGTLAAVLTLVFAIGGLWLGVRP